jgi:hypothetical protein
MNDPRSPKRQFTLRQLLGALTAVAIVLGIAAPWLRQIDPQFLPLVLSAVVWVAVATLVIGLGTLPLRSHDTPTATRREALAHGIGGGGLLVLAVFCVPIFLRIFREYEIPTLSPYAHVVLAVANFVPRRWFLALPCMIGFVALDGYVFGRLHSHGSTRWLAQMWSAALTMTLVSMVLFAAWALTRELFAWGGLGRTHYPF